MRKFVFILAALIGLTSPALADYQPKAEKVVDNVYAIVGPLSQRSADNDGLNANYGFVVTPEGVILIDSGASKLGAEKLATAIAKVTDQPVRWVINTTSQDQFAVPLSAKRTLPGDAWVWLPKRNVIFTGDLVYVDRILGVLPWSSVKNGQKASHALVALNPKHVVPGHGRVCDLAKAKRDSGDYEDFLANVIGQAAQAMESLPDTLAKYTDLPQFRHLENFNDLHRANMNRAFTEYEAE